MLTTAVADARKNAEEAYSSGLFCAESVLLALTKAQGVESELIPRMATAFCSGVSRTCGDCGALTGAIMGVSLALGRSAANEPVLPAYAATQEVIRTFEAEFGSRNCAALLDGCDLNTPEGQAKFKAEQLGQRCRRYTGRAAEIAVQVLAQHAV